MSEQIDAACDCYYTKPYGRGTSRQTHPRHVPASGLLSLEWGRTFPDAAHVRAAAFGFGLLNCVGLVSCFAEVAAATGGVAEAGEAAREAASAAASAEAPGPGLGPALAFEPARDVEAEVEVEVEN